MSAKMTKVEALDVRTGRVMLTFPSMGAAEALGFSRKLIGEVINGRSVHHKGYKWRRSGQVERKKEVDPLTDKRFGTMMDTLIRQYGLLKRNLIAAG